MFTRVNLPAVLLPVLVLLSASHVHAGCRDKKLYRWVVLVNFNDGVNVTQGVELITGAVKKCASTLARGWVGGDLGLGPSLYNSDTNFHAAAVVDVKSMPDLGIFLYCYTDIMATPQYAPYKAAKEVMALYNGTDMCNKWSLTGLPVAHVLMYNVTTKPNSDADLAKLDKAVKALVPPVKCTWLAAPMGVDNNWAADLGFPGASKNRSVVQPFQAYAGVISFKSINFLRAFWGFFNGPPTYPPFAEVGTMIDAGYRIQFTPVSIKD